MQPRLTGKENPESDESNESGKISGICLLDS
jgi:hypothetical protein